MAVWDITSPSVIRLLNCRLYWRDDDYGYPDQALYIGGLCIGCIIRFQSERRKEAPWRAWLQTDGDGEEIGWRATKQEAMDLLVDAALKEIMK
jgi:hypothetical protein